MMVTCVQSVKGHEGFELVRSPVGFSLHDIQVGTTSAQRRHFACNLWLSGCVRHLNRGAGVLHAANARGHGDDQ